MEIISFIVSFAGLITAVGIGAIIYGVRILSYRDALRRTRNAVLILTAAMFLPGGRSGGEGLPYTLSFRDPIWLVGYLARNIGPS